MKTTAFFKRAAAAAAVLAALWAAPVTCLAGIPEPADYFYVADYADVLTDKTETEILSDSEYLDNQCGAQIVVATVNFTDGMDMEDYAYRMYTDWAIGNSAGQGLLLLLSIGDDNYWVTQGKGLENQLSAGTLKTILDTYMEPSFAEKDYDKGVLLTYDQLYREVASICGVTAGTSGQTAGTTAGTGQTAAPQTGGAEKSGFRLPGVGTILLLILLFLILRKLLKLFTGAGRGGGPQPRTHRSAGTPRPGPGPGPGFGAGPAVRMSSRNRGFTGGMPPGRASTHRGVFGGPGVPPPFMPPPGRTASRPVGGLYGSRGTAGSSRPSAPRTPSRPSASRISAGRTTSSRPSTGRSMSSSRPTSGFSGSRHSGGGGSTRGGGAGRR